MQVVWVLVAVKMVSGLTSGGQVQDRRVDGNTYVGVEALPHWQPITAGMFAGEAACRTAAKALGNQPEIKPYSARCQPERLQ
jgi:hypothetical protein